MYAYYFVFSNLITGLSFLFYLYVIHMFSTEKPIYVPVTVEFNGFTWWNAGMRYKGQSSLFATKDSGCHKLAYNDVQ